jgi:hypothetical protein
VGGGEARWRKETMGSREEDTCITRSPYRATHLVWSGNEGQPVFPHLLVVKELRPGDSRVIG